MRYTPMVCVMMLGMASLPSLPATAAVTHVGKWAQVQHHHHKVLHANAAAQTALQPAVAVDPAGLCRGVIARALTQWGSQVDHFQLNVAPASEGVYLFRIDDTSRKDLWRQPVAHGQCLTGRSPNGVPQVESLSLGVAVDPAPACLANLVLDPRTVSTQVVGDPPDAQGIFHAIRAEGLNASGHVLTHITCPISLSPDGVYASMGTLP